jgi:hypothetical protein
MLVKKANKAQQQQVNLQAARQRRDAIRAARLANAQAVVTAENQGASTSSSAVGGQSSITSQLNSNLSFLDQYGTLSDQASAALGKAQTWEHRSKNGSAAAGLGMFAVSHSQQIEAGFNKIFKRD